MAKVRRLLPYVAVMEAELQEGQCEQPTRDRATRGVLQKRAGHDGSGVGRKRRGEESNDRRILKERWCCVWEAFLRWVVVVIVVAGIRNRQARTWKSR